VAKIHQQQITVSVCKLIRNDQQHSELVTPEVVSAIEQIVQELVGPEIIVEAKLEDE
jgi:hypothetical protein